MYRGSKHVPKRGLSVSRPSNRFSSTFGSFHALLASSAGSTATNGSAVWTPYAQPASVSFSQFVQTCSWLTRINRTMHNIAAGTGLEYILPPSRALATTCRIAPNHVQNEINAIFDMYTKHCLSTWSNACACASSTKFPSHSILAFSI